MFGNQGSEKLLDVVFLCSSGDLGTSVTMKHPFSEAFKKKSCSILCSVSSDQHLGKQGVCGPRSRHLPTSKTLRKQGWICPTRCSPSA